MLGLRGGPAGRRVVLLLLMAAAMMIGCGSGEGGEGVAANPAAVDPAAGGVNPEPPGQAAGAATVTAPAAAATDAIAATATMRPSTVAPAATGSRLAATATPMPTVAAEITLSLIQLVAPLDEPEFYCVDVPGFRDSLRTDRPLQAHTCKPGAADELFIAHQLGEGGQFLMPAYGLCMEAEEGLVYTRPCTNSRAQRFTHQEDLTIRTFEGDLCLAVAEGNGEPAGGRSHLRRDLRLLPCGEAAGELSRWVLPGERPG